MKNIENRRLLKEQIIEFLEGSFAPNVILLREFDHRKAGIVLDGLHFSAWILLGHIRARQEVLFNFIKDPEGHPEVWPQAYWPQNNEPKTRKEWDAAIDEYEEELQEVINYIKRDDLQLFKLQSNGKTISWAAMSILHHTGYHIGQLKTIGRQLGVW